MVSIEKTAKVKIDYSFFVRLVIENHTVIYKRIPYDSYENN